MKHGGICHIELATNDLEKTKAFYEELFNWTVSVIPGLENYAMFSAPEGVGGGINAVEEPAGEAGPILHIAVDDIEEALTRIEKAGGRVLASKTKISDEFGYYALFLDNVGNRLGVWSNG